VRAILLILALLAARALGPYGVSADSGMDVTVTNYRITIVRCCAATKHTARPESHAKPPWGKRRP